MFGPLPIEICLEIFDQLVLILGPGYRGLRVALRLRLVCKFFDREIIRAIHTTQTLAVGVWVDASERITSDYLRFQVLRNGGSDLYLINTIRTTVRALVLTEKGCISETDVHKYTTTLSEALVNVFPAPFLLFALHSNDGIDWLPKEHFVDSPQHLLSAAACVGNTDLVKRLLLQGVDCNTRSNIFGTPLHLAAYCGHAATAKLLLKSGAHPNTKAIRYNEIENTFYLDDKDRKDIFPKTPLQMACYAGQWEIVRLLLLPEHGVSLTGVHYHIAILSAIKGNHLDIVNHLINNGDLNSMQPEFLKHFWHRALRVACDRGAEGVVRMVLDKEVDVDSPRRALESPLSLAAGHGYEQIVRLLLEKGANPNRLSRSEASRKACTPFSKAAMFGHTGSLQLMLDSCVPEFPTKIISSAIDGGQKHVIQYLIEKGLWSSLSDGMSMNCDYSHFFQGA
ncbi:ankyrin repeat containing protein [Coccidioides posadasii C735 delta SOWgp]|uniref:Ankyrin repeat containing protein n=1 Tax=Coccidioides posadasii (strain C735) TaxID=222929 RepID=C5NZ68_COCP7|nr:ankyrin repeat containing protein [Coccidioides posadasii C735 delta SOWgp]EER30051.1 ankyrin repeat containing protein [Coccidioides posadasii C735 delta SOWgp]|eukprot:XP_003072196.1 ankyrin repeat containing protein [Coccidioides posadasii C735 delta SOWgp]